MEKSQGIRQSYQTSHLAHRPGVRIVTAIQPPHNTHQHVTIGQGQILDRNHYGSDQMIDFNKLAEDAADLFGDHEDLVLDPSLSEFALQVRTLTLRGCWWNDLIFTVLKMILVNLTF